MEVRAGVREADRLAVLLHVREDQDVRVLGMVELVDHVGLGLAELAREREESRGRELLTPENQDLGSEKRVPDLAEVRIDLVGFRAERCRASLIASAQLIPFVASNCFMRAQASGGSASSPAASASRKSSARCSTLRADCWPPTITKWSWWPFSHAMNTTPVL